jgi:uncharacterized protein GlcG (DUF336 family)
MRHVLLVTLLLVASAVHGQCVDGALGNATPASFTPLSTADVDAIVKAADASAGGGASIAVVDRAGRVLALFHQNNADPNNDDLAVGVARTAAFFSHNMAPLSSRTVRFISGVHFPAGVTNAPSAALYGIENTNRGCDLHTAFNVPKTVPPARSINGGPCDAVGGTSGCGPGIVTGKQLPDDGPYPQSVGNRPVKAGGIPLYRILGTSRVTEGIITDGRLVGGIGVVGIHGDTELDESIAVSGAFGALGSPGGPIAPVPQYPLPFPGNVFIDGIRLPFLGPEQKLRFRSDGLPIGLDLRPETSVHPPGTYVIAPAAGGCADNEYLAGPTGGTLNAAAVDAVVQRAIAAAKKTRAVIRLPLNSYARMVIAVADLDGSILALYRMPDATVFSIDVAVAKARNVIWFSSTGNGDLGLPSGTAVTNRTISFGAQPLYPPGIDSKVFKVGTGPFYPLFLHDLLNPCSQGSQPPTANQSGIVFFAGATPLFANGKLVGGLGVSGDGVEQDDYVTYLGAGSLLPPTNRWADQLKVNGARLPMFKFPRSPEGVTECGGKPCS